MIRFLIPCLFSIAFATLSCRDEPEVVELPRQLNDYHVYRFERDGLSTVRNTGQNVRNVLVQDLKLFIENLAKPGAQPATYEALYRYFDNGGKTIEEPILTPVHLPLNPPTLKAISGVRDLETRVNFTQWGDEITADIQEWCQTIADNSQEPAKLGTYRVYIDEETGFDLGEMFQKGVKGGVMLGHGLHGYFRNVHKKENDQVVIWGTDTLIYTEMEHHLDEAFGYYGAARNFYDFTLEELADRENGRNYRDNYDVDGFIDFRSEYNFSFALDAAQRDVTSATGTEYASTIYEAFYQARRSIVQKQYDSLIYQKTIILEHWEKVNAATAIHYLNALRSALDLLEVGDADAIELVYKYWSALFKYVELFRYNYDNNFTEWEYARDNFVRTTDVPYPKALVDEVDKIPAYRQRLMELRTMLEERFGFAPQDVENW